MAKQELEQNLNQDEFMACRDLYEKTTGNFFLPTNCEDQTIWIAAFEQAKKYFEDVKRDG